MEQDRSHDHDREAPRKGAARSSPARVRPVISNRALAEAARSSDAHPVGAGTASRIAARRGSGSPLPTPARADLERASGADLGAVRVHTDAEADRLTTDVHAAAFTSGSDVFFGAGRFDPSTTSGRDLIGHEIGHVVGAPPQAGVVHRQPAPDDDTDDDDDDGGERKPAELPYPDPSQPSEVLENAFVDLGNQIAAIEESDRLGAAKLERQLLLVQFAVQPDLQSVDGAEEWVVKCREDSENEDVTLGLLGKMRDQALRDYPQAFPDWWSKEVKRRLDFGVDGQMLQDAATAAWNTLQNPWAARVPAGVVQDGLPVDYPTALKFDSYPLKPDLMYLPDPHVVKDYAQAAWRYRGTAYASTFILVWNGFLANLVAAVKAGQVVVNPRDIDRLLGGTSRLGAMAKSGGAADEDAFRELDADVANLDLAAFGVGAQAYLQSMKTSAALWKQAGDLFDQKIVEADGTISGLGPLDTMSKAFWWAFYNDYFVAAVKALAAAISHIDIKSVIWDILEFAATAAIAAEVPIIGWAIDAYYLANLGVEFIKAMALLAEAFWNCATAKTVISLQRAAANLADALVNDGLRGLASWLGLKGTMASIEARAAEYMAADAALTRQKALQKAAQLSDMELEQGEAKIAEQDATPALPTAAEEEAGRALEAQAEAKLEADADDEVARLETKVGETKNWQLLDLSAQAELFAEEGMARWLRIARKAGRIHLRTEAGAIEAFGEAEGKAWWAQASKGARGTHRKGHIFIDPALSLESATTTLVHETTHWVQRLYLGDMSKFAKEFQAYKMQQRYIQRLASAPKDLWWLLQADDLEIERHIFDRYGVTRRPTDAQVDDAVNQMLDTYADIGAP